MKNEYWILSIDAWAEDTNSWTWNDWRVIGTLSPDTKLPDTVEQFVKACELEPSDEFDPNEYTLDDDQHNIVLVRKEDMMPIYAIEYGSVVNG
jgi:hypothetical protein